MNIFKILLLFILIIDKGFSQAKKSSFSISPLPVIYYAPETRLGLGVSAVAVFCTTKDSSSITTKSFIQPYFIYTQNKQMLSNLLYTLFSKHNKWRTEGECAYFLFPEFYYGIGNNLPSSNEQLISYNWFRILNKSGYRIANAGFWGWNFERIATTNVRPTSENGIFQNEPPLGSNGGVVMGIGPQWFFDTRDNVLNASKGWFADISLVFYDKLTFSDFKFKTLILDIRNYHALNKKRNLIIAFQLFSQLVFGEAPYKSLSVIGSESYTRGYYPGRYRDNFMVSLQSEIRFPVFRRFSGTTFVSVANIGNDFNDIFESVVKYSFGVGLRYKINRKENVNIRLDYGQGYKSSGNYINFGEAF